MDYTTNNNLEKGLDISKINMDETEDEEVKANAFGMRHYHSSSEEEDSDDESHASDVERPLRFASGKNIRGKVYKPKPLKYNDVDGTAKTTGLVKRSQIIHNECEFSEEEGEEETFEEDEEDNHIVNQFDSSFYDSHVENDDGEETSVAAGLEASHDDGSVDSDESSRESDGDDESLDSDEDSSVGSNLNEREDEDEFTDDEADDDASVEESDDEARVECSYEEDTENDEALDITTESKQIPTESTFAESDDDGSVCASDVQELIEKPAASTDMYFSEEDEALDQEESNGVNFEPNEDVDDADVMKCLIDPEEYDALNIQAQPLKRVLSTSCQQPMNITPEDHGSITKRNCRRASVKRSPDENGVQPPFLPALSIGESAIAISLDQRKRQSPQLSASSEEEIVDSQLADELIDGIARADQTTIEGRDPVPLLTPPSTPNMERRSSTGQFALCEWPSNLAVDNALTAAAYDDRPLSPSTLARMEEQDSTADDFITTPVYDHCARLRSVSDVITPQNNTGLTPMLQSIGMPSAQTWKELHQR